MQSDRTLEIREADGASDFLEVERLFLEYAAWFETAMGHDFCFQGFDGELASLPAPYNRPRGNAWLARDSSGTPQGVVAVKPLGEAGACEMKRLWVRESARGSGLGRRLAEISIDWSRAAGYSQMKLDTLERMTSARALYAALGFEETEPYVENPIEDVVFLAKRLR